MALTQEERQAAGEKAWAEGSPELTIAQNKAIKDIAVAANYCDGKEYKSLTGDDKTKYEEASSARQLRLEPFFGGRGSVEVVNAVLKNRLAKAKEGRDPASFSDVKGVRQISEKTGEHFKTKKPIQDSYTNISVGEPIKLRDLEPAHLAVIEERLTAAGINSNLLPSNNRSDDPQLDSGAWTIDATIDMNLKNVRAAGESRGEKSLFTNSNGDKIRLYPEGTHDTLSVTQLKEFANGPAKDLVVWKYCNQFAALDAKGKANTPLVQVAKDPDPETRALGVAALKTAFFAVESGYGKVARRKGADGRDAPTLMVGRIQLGTSRVVGTGEDKNVSGLLHESEKVLARKSGDNGMGSYPVDENGKVSENLSPNSMTTQFSHTSGGIVLGASTEPSNKSKQRMQDAAQYVGAAPSDIGL